ncbi:MAG: LLM class flavin-dependent oxidoreductase, partial [Rhabdochlamydiaceae bacterium]
MKFSFGGANLFGGSTADEAVDLVKYGEELGYETAWFSDNVRDPYAVMSAAATTTSKIKLGVGVTDPFKRHPLIAARSIATVDELCRKRAILGLGTGAYLETLRYYGISEKEWRNTGYARVSEMIKFVRRLFQGQSASGSEFFKTEETRLLINTPRNIPIYVAGSGPKILEVAGQLADGVIIWAAEPKFLTSFLKYVRNGAEKAGRSMDSIDVV